MEIARTAVELDAALAPWREGRIGLVPTMGALHPGHLSLLGLARQSGATRLVASIFVNPSQFGPHEDLARYPRTPEQDASALAAAGCDLLFLPTADSVYPPGFASWIEPLGPALGLEGTERPGHFRGVATVVARLFALVRPQLAVLGRKDAQQLAVVRRLVEDLGLPVEIVAAPIFREPDGLAMSSRNRYLSPAERSAAAAIPRALELARAAIEGGEREAATIRGLLVEALSREPLVERVDYAEVVDAESFAPLDRLAGEIVIPVAVRIGATRLLDNLQLELS